MIRVETESLVGCPVSSRAGVNLAREVSSLQVVESSEAEPLDEVTVQLVTRPLVPISRRTAVVPCSSFRCAADG